MEWPLNYQKQFIVVNMFMIYVAGCMLSSNWIISLLLLIANGTLMLSGVGDLLKEKEERMKKEKQIKEEQEEKELGFHPVQ